jgi:hypothetical protein
MKAYGGIDIEVHISLTSALVGGKWSASRPGRFTPRERAPGTHWIAGWVDPRAGLDDWRSKNSWPHRDSNSDPSVVQPAASRYTDYAIRPFLNLMINDKSVFVSCRVLNVMCQLWAWGEVLLLTKCIEVAHKTEATYSWGRAEITVFRPRYIFAFLPNSTIQTINFLELSPSWEVSSAQKSKEFYILWNTKFHYPVNKSPSRVPVLSQMNPVHHILIFTSL